MTIPRTFIPERPTPVPRLFTPGRIAETLGVPLHRVLHILRTRKHIQPRAFAGNIRLFRSEAVAEIRHELEVQEAQRWSRQGGQRD